MDFLVVTLVCSIAILAVSAKGKIKSKELAFMLQIISDVAVFFSYACRLYAETENLMTSSQRVVDYTKLDPEDELIKSDDKVLKKANWPDKGEVEFKEATMRYRECLEPSISNLTFKAQPGMKVGIVGRTGAGKSSIL